jgi:hypothetical protein
MLRIGGTASPGHITVFRGLKTHFQQQGIALDWVLYRKFPPQKRQKGRIFRELERE